MSINIKELLGDKETNILDYLAQDNIKNTLEESAMLFWIQKCLREKYYLHIKIDCDCSVNEIFGYTYTIHQIMAASLSPFIYEEDNEPIAYTYEESLNKAIRRALTLIK